MVNKPMNWMLWRSHGYLHITPPFSRGLLETLKSCQPAPNLPSGKHEKKYTPEKPTWNPTKLVVCRCFSIDVSPFSRHVSSGFMLVFKGCKIHFNQSSSPNRLLFCGHKDQLLFKKTGSVTQTKAFATSATSQIHRPWRSFVRWT